MDFGLSTKLNTCDKPHHAQHISRLVNLRLVWCMCLICVLSVSTCVYLFLPVFTCIYLYLPLPTCVLPVSICVYVCLTCIYLCLTCIYLCLTCVLHNLPVSTSVYLCPPVSTCVLPVSCHTVGPLVLYKGITPALMRSFPANGALWLAYSVSKPHFDSLLS